MRYIVIIFLIVIAYPVIVYIFSIANKDGNFTRESVKYTPREHCIKGVVYYSGSNTLAPAFDQGSNIIRCEDKH